MSWIPDIAAVRSLCGFDPHPRAHTDPLNPAHPHERSTILPPRPPVDYPNPNVPKRTGLGSGEMPKRAMGPAETARELDNERMENQKLEGRIHVLNERIELYIQRMADLNNTITMLLKQQGAGEFAHIVADETGVFAIEIATGDRHTLVRFDGLQEQVGELLARKFVEAEEAEHAARADRIVQALSAWCRYPYLQDEVCKLPAGHISEHGPAHECDAACDAEPGGCALPVPANPVPYYKALYWELHGSKCPDRCRGHSGG